MSEMQQIEMPLPVVEWTRKVTIDDITITYTNLTEFRVEIGRNKSAYKTRYCLKGNPHGAVALYRGINIGNGYKKRLMMDDRTLAKTYS